MKHQRLTVRVPATTANLGPGFDCLGMALDLWNEVTLEVAEGDEVSVAGEGRDSLALDLTNRVVQAARRAFREAGEAAPPLRVTCNNRIPLARGLGSSAAAAVGGLVAANEMAGGTLSQGRLLALATEMEGHPDNVAPALLGGLRIVYETEAGLQTASAGFPPELYAVLFVPDHPMPTAEARAVLPTMVSRKDAVYNLARTALVVHALESGEVHLLREATSDRLHQPQRRQLFPPMKHVIRGALAGGAYGAFLSGGGPTVLALTIGRRLTIGYEMADAASKVGEQGDIKVVQPTRLGAHVVAE